MDELENKIPADLWRKAFDEAAESPPPRVWDAIERQLDESKGSKVIPLWGTELASSRPFLWTTGVAAAVILVLVGWWSVSVHSPTNRQQVASPYPRASSTASATPESVGAANSSAGNPQKKSFPNLVSATKPVGPLANGSTEAVSSLHTSSVASQSENAMASLSLATQLLTAGNQLMRVEPEQASFAYARRAVLNESSPNANESVSSQSLQGRSMHFRKFGQIQRIVWFSPGNQLTQPDVVKSKRKSRDVWASLSVMPGSFNPMVAVQMASATSNAFKGTSSITTSQQSVSSQANFSVAYQAGAGVQLTNRWSVESGIGYLAGRSTVITPAQLPASTIAAVTDRNGTSGNLYIDALYNSMSNRNSNANQASLVNTANTLNPTGQTAYSSSTSQALTNDYQYVQMPVQIGYQLRPRKRLSLALLGGIITNIFVRNTVSNEVIVTAKDGIYRPVSLAATVGARFRYQPTGQWSASLAGSYQPSLGAVTQASSQVQSHPTTAGMTFGVDYHF